MAEASIGTMGDPFAANHRGTREGNHERKEMGLVETIHERIEAAFDTAINNRTKMMDAQASMQRAEETAKMENLEEWTQAKNNDVRKAIILRELADDESYHEERANYERRRGLYRLDLLEIERLKLLVEYTRAGSGGSW